MKIKYEFLFKQMLTDGISLFLGSGFSLHAKDKEGNFLPTGAKLLSELKDRYEGIATFTDLARACTVIGRRYGIKSLNDTLTERFTVLSFDDLYSNILRVNIKRIFTTNIDNLIMGIYSGSDDKYINNTSVRGETSDESGINYYPLHGCVCNPDSGYTFSHIDIASAYRDQNDGWKRLRNDLVQYPVIFWGWSYNDSDIIEAIYKNQNKKIDNMTNRWIVLFEPSDEEIGFYEALGLNIIESDTKELLEYFGDVKLGTQYRANYGCNSELHKYDVPKIEDEAVYPINYFFEGDRPRISYVLSGKIAKLHYYNDICELIVQNKNVIVKGIPASGKSTLMLQIASNSPLKKTTHMMYSPSMEEMILYIERLKEKESILFVDDCINDYKALLCALKCKNIQVVGFDRDVRYENVSFLLRRECVEYELVDISDINNVDRWNIINSVPLAIRTNRNIENSAQSLFDIVRSCINTNKIEDRFSNYIDYMLNINPIETELFLLICYVHSCGTPVSFDMIFSYMSDYTIDYREMYSYLEKMGKMIQECMGDDSGFLARIDFQSQDYYRCRTRYMAEMIVFRNRNYNLMRCVLNTFVNNVPAFKICRFDVFKRVAFDADIIARFYPKFEEGIQFYETCFALDESPYVLQQSAIYAMRRKQYRKAFELIEMARSMTGINKYSIDNTYANILFNCNIEIAHTDTDGSVFRTLAESLDVIEKCYNSDAKKWYHAATYGDFTIKLSSVYGWERSEMYIEKAYRFLDTEKENGDLSYKNRRWINKLYSDIRQMVS